MTEAQRKAVADRARHVEDWGLVVGLFIATLYSVGEFVVYMGLVTPPAERDFPYMTVIMFLGCVLPKMLGRATTGQVWIILAQGVARMLGGKKNGRPTVAVQVPKEDDEPEAESKEPIG